jgi:hypothetical protein
LFPASFGGSISFNCTNDMNSRFWTVRWPFSETQNLSCFFFHYWIFVLVFQCISDYCVVRVRVTICDL